MTVNTRSITAVLLLLAVGISVTDGVSKAVLVGAGIVLSAIFLAFEPTRIEISAKNLLSDPKLNTYDFEKWLESKPELLHAIKIAHNLSPDDFQTFCCLLVEVRYHKDQNALKLVSSYFNRERK